jgi:GT2 family glycosyltransferase
MTSDSEQRKFSESKHYAGQWDSADIFSSNPIIRELINYFSFKRREVDKLSLMCSNQDLAVDLGAGQGSYSAWFRGRNGYKVISIDWSFNALAKLKKLNKNNLLLCADLHFLPIKPDKIDALFSIDTLGHLNNQEKALDEILRVCRGGAKLFLHSECSDYKSRWPDSWLIKKTGCDMPAEYDGHISLRPSYEIRSLISQRFHLTRFYSPMGIAGWLTGYPEKYAPAFKKSGNQILYYLAVVFAFIKKTPLAGNILRFLNVTINKIELLLRIEGGGSCFAFAEKNLNILSLKNWKDRSVDIIIATYLRNEKIESLCSKLERELRSDDHIFIINQGPDLTINNSEKITITRLGKPSLPAARNTGLLKSKADIVLFLDDDIVPMEGLLDAHRKSYDQSSIGAVAGCIDDPLFDRGQTVPSIYNEKTGELNQNFSLPESQITISMMGANMSFRRDVLIDIGGFDANYTGNALWEDVDCAFRTRSYGYDIWYCAEAKVIHERAEAGGCRNEKGNIYTYSLFSNAAYFACKYVPIKNAGSWLKFWKYRLEYLSRIPDKKLLRHDPSIIISASAGFFSGLIKYMFKSQKY